MGARRLGGSKFRRGLLVVPAECVYADVCSCKVVQGKVYVTAMYDRELRSSEAFVPAFLGVFYCLYWLITLLQMSRFLCI